MRVLKDVKVCREILFVESKKKKKMTYTNTRKSNIVELLYTKYGKLTPFPRFFTVRRKTFLDFWRNILIRNYSLIFYSLINSYLTYSELSV